MTRMTRAWIGDWVEITEVVLKPEERAPNIPPDTAAVPYLLRVRGFAVSEAEMGDEITITTAAGRRLRGKLEGIHPAFRPDFGESIPELIRARFELKEMARESK